MVREGKEEKKESWVLLKMKKEKIKSISHTDKIWWIRVRPTSKSVVYINKILKHFDPWHFGLKDCSCELGEKYSIKYNFWKNRGISFFTEEECGYIFYGGRDTDFIKKRIKIV